MKPYHISALLAGASLTALNLAAATNSIPALQNIIYGPFTQTATYSIAYQLAFFTAYGLSVTYSQVPNSTYGYAQLLSGDYDVLTGTIDNVVNLRFNSNRSITVVGQLDQGAEIAIVPVPNVTSVAQLKGRSLMVDSATSGYPFVLRKILSLYGLNLENGDYTFQVSGQSILMLQGVTC